MNLKFQLATAAVALLFCAPSCTTPAPERAGTVGGSPPADPHSQAIAQREVVRREQALRDAQRLLEAGRRNEAGGDHKAAIEAYQKSLGKLP